MSKINRPPDLGREIAALRKRIAILENAPRLTASSIRTNGNSRLGVITAAGETVLHAGDVNVNAGGTQPGFALFRPSALGGTAAISAVALPSAPGGFQAGIYDQNGQPLLTPNETTGWGVEAPAYTFPMYANTLAAWPSTTSTTAVALLQGYMVTTHSYFTIGGFAFCPAGTTGQISLQLDGVNVGSPISIPANVVTAWAFNALPTNITTLGSNALSQVAVLGKTVSGAGAIAAMVAYSFQRGS